MKKLIEKFIHKLLRNCYKNRKRVLFARWLAEFVRNEYSTTNAMADIATYLVRNNEGLSALPFTDIFVVGNIVYVCTTRPGLWIGKGGSTVEAIEHIFNYNVRDEKIADYHIRFIEVKDMAVNDIANYIHIMNEY